MTDVEAEPAESTEVSAVTPAVSAFVLSVTAHFESDITVTGAGHTDFCAAGTTCNFAFLQGTAVTVQTDAKNLIDCAGFSGWTGACSGQGAKCSLVVNSDLATAAKYRFGLPGCIPL